MRAPPSDSFPQADAADLAALDRDAPLLSCLSEGIQTPLSRSLLIPRDQLIGSSLQSPRRGLAHQGNDSAVLLGCQAARPPGFGPVAQPFDPLGIKAVETATDRLGATVQLLGNGFYLLALPTTHHNLGMKHPIGWCVPTRGQFAHPSLFFLILSRSRSQDLWHLVAPFR
jgi:hypothetical protein